MTVPYSPPRRLRPVVFALALAVLLAGCGSGDKGASKSKSSTTAGAAGASAGDLSVQVASYDLAVGPATRLIAGVVTGDGRLVGFGTVSMRVSYLGTKVHPLKAVPGPALEGRYLAIPGSEGPQPTPATPQIVTASTVRGLYATEAAFDRAGFWQVEVTAKLEGREVKGTGAFPVLDKHAVPAPGDKALSTDTLTMTTPDTPKAAVDSRGATGEIPDPELHQTTIAAALAAKRPVVAVFATPVYCTSRFCGPVTDMVQQLAHDYGDRASFVHVEIWRDFEKQVVNKSAADWLFRNDDLNEPWVFIVGADGIISIRLDNVATRGEIEPLLQTLPVIGPATPAN